MPLAKPIRWALVIVGVACLLFVAPFGLIVAGNVGAGVLSSILDRRPTTNELVGDYEYRAGWGQASLELNRDGTFREQIEERGQAPRVVSGLWTTLGQDNDVDVSFRPFGEVQDDDHNTLNGDSGMPFFKPHFGKTYGVIDDDLGERFQQQ